MAAAKKKERGAAPKVSDFSQGAIKKAVLKEGLTHPLTLFPPALGVLSGLAGALFSFPPLLAVALGACLLGAGSGIVNIFLREEALAGKYLQALNELQEEHEALVLESLRDELEEQLENKVNRQYAERGIEQFDRCRKKYQNVEDLLNGKLSSAEISYGRFQSAAKQVYLSVLDNLKTTAAVLRSAGTIDHQYIKDRLNALSRNKSPKPADKKEAETLNDRLKLLENQLNLVSELLAGNEEAMTRLEETTSNIAMMNTDGRFASTDFETAINYLQEIADSASSYDAHPAKSKALIIEEV